MPLFSNIGRLDYSDYWRERGFALQSKLREREVIMLEYQTVYVCSTQQSENEKPL